MGTPKPKENIPHVIRRRDAHYGNLFPIDPDFDNTPMFEALANIGFYGDVVPHSWHNYVLKDDNRRKGAKVGNPLAMLVLARIVYKHRPQIERDDRGKTVMLKRFPEGVWITSYKEIMQTFSYYSRKQLREAMDLLEELDVIFKTPVNRLEVEAKETDTNGKTVYVWKDLTGFFAIELNWKLILTWTDVSENHDRNEQPDETPQPPAKPATPPATQPDSQPTQQHRVKPETPADSVIVHPLRNNPRAPMAAELIEMGKDYPTSLAERVYATVSTQMMRFSPPGSPDYDREWLQPARLCLALAAGNVDGAADLAIRAHTQLVADGYHPKSMAGLENTIVKIYNEERLSTNGKSDSGPYAGLNEYTLF